MKRLIVLIAAASSLSACQSAGGCPPLVQYRPETQKAAAAEMRKGASPTLNTFVVDYGKLRDACRATGTK